MIYLKWVILSPSFRTAGSIWRNEQNSRMKELLKNSGLIPVNFHSTRMVTQMLYVIPASENDVYHGTASVSAGSNHTVYQCHMSWQCGKGFLIKEKGYTHDGFSLHPYRSDSVISSFIQYVSHFNHTFDDDLFLDLSFHKISVKS